MAGPYRTPPVPDTIWLSSPMIYLVDNSLDGNGDSPREIADALTRLGYEVVTEHYTRASPRRLAELDAGHVVLSGQPSPWDRYAPEDLAGVFEIIRTAPRPVLGICGGHQQIALCHGATIGLMKRVSPGAGYEGALRVRGFHDVELDPGVFGELSGTASMWHSHCDEVKNVPEGFELVATSAHCRIAAIRHTSLPVIGVQFHPDLFDAEHPAGRGVLEHFLAM